MGQRKKEMVIPQEGKIQMMIQPTHGIITIKLVKIRRRAIEELQLNRGQFRTVASEGEQLKNCS